MLSKDSPKSTSTNAPAGKARIKAQKITSQTTNAKTQTPFIELPNGITIALEPHEVTKAKKDGYKIIYK